MVWATPRKAPKAAYLLLEAHPLIKRGYTPKLKITNNLIIIIGHLNDKLFKGVILHRTKTVASITTGLKKNNFQLTL